jgi:hypothetical protein
MSSPAGDCLASNPWISTAWVKVWLRPTVMRPICLAVAQDLFVTVTQLWVWWCGAPSLTRGRVCRLLATGPRHSRHSRILLPYFNVSDSRLRQHEKRPMTQEQGGPVIPPENWVPFRRLLRLAGLRWRYSNLPPHGSYDHVQVRVQATLRPTVSWGGLSWFQVLKTWHGRSLLVQIFRSFRYHVTRKSLFYWTQLLTHCVKMTTWML